MHRFLAALTLAGVLPLASAGENAFNSSPANPDFFEKQIRPLLADNCYSCHSERSEHLRGGLRLDSREGLLKGGDSGPAAIPGDPENSLIVKAVRYSDKDLQMPPRKGKLPDKAIQDLVRWISAGADWPIEQNSNASTAKRSFEITEKDRAYWAFQPIRRPALPAVQHPTWIANGIDAFILEKLETKGLMPNSPASPQQLIRRLYFDLVGLPPTPSEIARFLKDPSPNAYARLVDQLLARPEYGERWARHWLDVVRYAQSNGYERDGEKPLAWRYRDYVIGAFNEDKRYDRFIQEQIAGDELPDATADSIVATGFQRLGVWDDEPDDPAVAEYDGLDDIVSTTGAAFLGLTLGCARCHDHKFDPISQKDYYQFLAFFRNVCPNDNARYTLDSPNYLPLAPPAKVREWQEMRERHIQSFDSRIACASDLMEKNALEQQLHKLKKEEPPFEWALGVKERGLKSLPTHILVRGNPKAQGPEVEPSFLTVLGPLTSSIECPPDSNKTRARRLRLAQWLSSPKNPLTARVAVNRVWQHHFGQGIVKTTSDFGHTGSPPTHPDLLDWLAEEFIEKGWSFKQLHRIILLSHTYQMSSRTENEKAQEEDPADELLWHQRLRRLEAESIRDIALSVSGELNHKMGGRGFFPHLDAEVLAGESRPGLDWEISTESEEARRSIYIFTRRTMLFPMLESFDYSNSSSPLAERGTTTVAPQALMLLNGGWVQQRALAFALRLAKEAGANPSDRIRLAYQLAFGRSPTSNELGVALGFLRRQSEAWKPTQSQITFRPAVPGALFDGYMKQLQPVDYLEGPRLGWKYYSGRWSAPYESIRTMDRDRGPFALWNGEPFDKGSIKATLLLHPSCEFAALLFSSKSEAQEQRGYELVFDPRLQRVSLRRHGKEIQVLAQSKVPIPWGQAFPVRVEVRGNHFQVWIGVDAQSNKFTSRISGAALPLLDVVDSQSVREKGLFGVRTAGAALTIDRLTLRTEDGEQQVWLQKEVKDPELDREMGSQIEPKAWQSFCLLLFNLNEFIYVD